MAEQACYTPHPRAPGPALYAVGPLSSDEEMREGCLALAPPPCELRSVHRTLPRPHPASGRHEARAHASRHGGASHLHLPLEMT